MYRETPEFFCNFYDHRNKRFKNRGKGNWVQLYKSCVLFPSSFFSQLLKKIKELSNGNTNVIKKVHSFAWPRRGKKDGYDSGVDSQDGKRIKAQKRILARHVGYRLRCGLGLICRCRIRRGVDLICRA